MPTSRCVFCITHQIQHAVVKNHILPAVPSKKYGNSVKNMSNILRNAPESHDS